MITFLQRCGARALAARNADAALAYLSTTRVDMIISDLAMPGKDGISLIRAIRRSGGPLRSLPAIAITGFPEDFVNARAEGFDAFIAKPVNVDNLARVLRDFFSMRRTD